MGGKKYEENTDFCRDFMFGYYSDTDDRMWKSGTVVSDKEDDCIVVELPDDYGVRDIFNIVSSTEISVSAISDPTVAQFYMIGKLEDGGSVVWRSKEEQTFVYTEKEVKGVEVSHYGNELRDKTPISLEEFDEICESKKG